MDKGFRNFSILLLAQATAVLGNSMANFGLGIWAYQHSGAVTDLAKITLASSIPTVLLSPLAGTLVDRWNRKHILLAGECVSMLVMAVMAFLLWSGQLAVAHITVLAALAASVSAFVLPTISASVPLIVGRENIGRANGLASLVLGIVQILSPALAGMTLAGVGMMGIFVFAFGGALINGMTLLLMPIPQPPASHEASAKESVWQSFLAGVECLRERRGLGWLILFYGAIAFNMSCIFILLTPMVLGFTDARGAGLISSTAGIGMVLGGILMLAWGGPQRKILGVLGGGFFMCIGLILAPVWPSTTTTAIGALFIAACFPVITACNQTLFQHKIPVHQQGRVFGLRNFVIALIQPVGILVSAPLAQYFFEPAMQPDGWLADLLGDIYGTGKGRGAAVMISGLGLLTLLWTAIAMASRTIRRLDLDLPDQPLTPHPGAQ